MNSNIRAQLRQFQEVEASLPSAFKTRIYVNAIKAEAEAAEYIKQMTENIHRVHAGLSPFEPLTGVEHTASESEKWARSQEDWDVFISHFSEDKEAIGAPLAQGLVVRGLRVWYDEFSLTLGDSLRGSIDRGLARSRFGIVILSGHFFQKHWPQRELNGLATREVNGEKVILPIWHGIDFAEVRNYSPMLADRVAVQTKDGLVNVIEKIMAVVTGK